MWFKKKVYISGYNSNTAYDGTDWRTTNKSLSRSASQTLPSAVDAGKYFYLPRLGYYRDGTPYNIGRGGYYWSSSAYPPYSGYAFHLDFYGSGSGTVVVNGDVRSNGRRVGDFE